MGLPLLIDPSNSAADGSVANRSATDDAAPDSAAEGRLFWKLRARTIGNIVTEFVQRARLRAAAFFALSLLFWGILFLLFADGFSLLQSALTNPGLRGQVIRGVFNAFFFTLLTMITISAAIVLYGGLYRSREVELLMQLPVRAERIVMHKFQEAVLVSSWGFLLLGTPLLIAYGVTVNAPWQYFALLGPFMGGFVLVPTSLGAIGCLLAVRWFPKVPRRFWNAVGLVAGALVVGALLWYAAAPARDLLTPKWLQEMLARLRFSEHRLLPNWWLSAGMLAAAHHGRGVATDSWSDPLGLLGVLWANALALQVALAALARGTFRAGYHRVQGLSSSRTVAGPHWMDRLAFALFVWFPRDMQQMVVKDLRTFRRDPTLWAQLAVFLGLLTLYLINLRRLDYGAQTGNWVNAIGFLNVGVVALIHSTFATRFILPLLSLEGRSFWVPGTAPIARDTLLWSKFALAASISTPPCVALVLASDVSLRVWQRDPAAVGLHALTIVALSATLSALAVGNGARFPNLRDNAPSRIAAGFGGTLNLVVSCVVIALVATAVGVPGYFWCEESSRAPDWRWWPEIIPLGSQACMVAGVAAALTVCGGAAWLALDMGLRAIRRLES